MDELTRRELIVGLLALAAGGVPGVGDRFEASGGAAAFGLVLRNPASAIALGRAYLAARPEEADLARLARALESALGVRPGDPPAELRRRLVARIRADFEQEEVVAVGGWWLSQTEARVTALAALAGDPA
jgi:hypothetical protein